MFKTVLAATLASVLAIAVVSGSIAQTAGGTGRQTPPPPGGRGRLEKHPELRRAMRNLMQAQGNLTHAAHDFAGHREKALDLTQKAIEEVRLALAADRR